GNAVAVWIAGSGSLWATSRNVSTGLWASPVQISDVNPDVDRYFFSVSVDATGNAIAAWTAVGRSVLETAYRPAGGAWVAPVVVARNASIFLSLAQNDSTALLVWFDTDSGRSRLRAAFGRNGSWDPPETLATDLSDGGLTTVLGADGTAVVGWT